MFDYNSIQPMSSFDPPITDDCWGPLPFPFAQMQGARLEITTTDTRQVFDALLHVNRHPIADDLFSAVVVVSHLPTGTTNTLRQIRARLSPLTASLIAAHLASNSDFGYQLYISYDELDYAPLPNQLRP